MGLDVSTIGQYLGETLYTRDGDSIGKIGQIFLDDATRQPEWVTVHTGLFGTKETFVPLADAAPHEGGLAVPFTKDRIKDAPRVSLEHGHLSQDEEERLYRFYDVDYTRDGSDTVLPAAGRRDEAVRDEGVRDETVRAEPVRDETVRDEPVRDDVVRDETVRDEPVRDRADDDEGVTVTRSEEQVRVTGTERVATGKARLRKYVETEYRTVTVPVRTEKVALETEPVAEEDLDAAARAAAERKVREEG